MCLRDTDRLSFLLLCFNVHFLPNFLWSFVFPHLLSLYTFPASHLAKSLSLFPPPLDFGDGMCSCCCLPLSHRCLCLSAWGLWDCGRAALPWQRAVLPNCVHLGFGVSLRSSPSLLFIPPSSQVFFWCSRGYQQPSLSLSLCLPSLTLHSLSPSNVLSHT